jgi:hypothetical protein
MKIPLTIMGAKKLLKGSHMGFGRKSKAVKMLRRKGQAKKKAKIKQKIAAGKLTKKR